MEASGKASSKQSARVEAIAAPEITAALPAIDQTFYSHSIKMSKRYSPLLRFPLRKGLAAGDTTAVTFTKARGNDATQTLGGIHTSTQVTAQNDSPPPHGRKSPWMESSIHLLTGDLLTCTKPPPILNI